MGNYSTINDLLEANGFELIRTGFARHPYSSKNVRHLLAGGYMDLSMGLQDKGRFDKFDQVLSFIGYPFGNSLFLRGYRVMGYHPDASAHLKDYPFSEHITGQSVFYRLEPLQTLQQYERKLVIDWGQGARAWLQNGKKTKPILAFSAAPIDPETFEPREVR